MKEVPQTSKTDGTGYVKICMDKLHLLTRRNHVPNRTWELTGTILCIHTIHAEIWRNMVSDSDSVRCQLTVHTNFSVWITWPERIIMWTVCLINTHLVWEIIIFWLNEKILELGFAYFLFFIVHIIIKHKELIVIRMGTILNYASFVNSWYTYCGNNWLQYRVTAT